MPSERSRVPPRQQVINVDRWPIVGERAPRPWDGEWTMSVTGEVGAPKKYTLASLRELGTVAEHVDIHCVTRWSRLGVRFVGVPLAKVFGDVNVKSSARFASFVAYSEHGHSSSLPLDVLDDCDALLAFEADGEPLAIEHGGPVRLIVPGRYFYKSVKWLRRIELLVDDVLGYWEAAAGFHNGADPWREQRFVGRPLSKPQVRRLIETRDFRGVGLLCVDVSKRDLSGMIADDSTLRGADFRECTLVGASFQRANLTGARLERAELREATFADADLEGAALEGADLRGADFRGASLIGVTFLTGEFAARIDATTRFDAAAFDGLAAEQTVFVESTGATVDGK